MSRSISARRISARRISGRRAGLVAAVGLTAATLLSGCFAPAPPTVPTTTPPSTTPPSTTTGFPGLGVDPLPLESNGPDVPTGPAPDGVTSLTDDYSVLSIHVPADWSDVDGSSFTSDDGQEWASLTATTDLDAYFAAYDVSGMEFAGSPAPDGLTPAQLQSFLGMVSDYFLTDCEVLQEAVTYEDAFYTGFQSGFENCGGIGTEGFAIVAVDKGGNNVVFLRSQIAGADDPGTVYELLARTFQSSITSAAP